ncbi:hypothetical protein B296_00048130 [Ensete ventricosum]|uniref:Uncharacterized protein n=1 Tax=Ensete ventricosum TaxID=4639 RepID=A0A426Y421_ENSVE|nr:hypothetical protein B296_00048130 [Ensete ventricosum]
MSPKGSNAECRIATFTSSASPPVVKRHRTTQKGSRGMDPALKLKKNEPSSSEANRRTDSRRRSIFFSSYLPMHRVFFRTGWFMPLLFPSALALDREGGHAKCDEIFRRATSIDGSHCIAVQRTNNSGASAPDKDFELIMLIEQKQNAIKF